jgi:hypothetical protein
LELKTTVVMSARPVLVAGEKTDLHLSGAVLVADEPVAPDTYHLGSR